MPGDSHDLNVVLEAANDLKQEGNVHFKAGRWDEALVAYRSALGHLPRRPEPLSSHRDNRGKSRDTDDSDDEPEVGGSKDATSDDVTSENALNEEAHEDPPSELDMKCTDLRAILNANIAACYTKLNDHKEVVAACTEALKDNPKYIKVLNRRVIANEKIDTWSSLSAAQEDYKTLLELLPANSSELSDVRQKLNRLTPRVEAAQKRETAEMMDKLKGLGNSILGNFGLSTNNFQFVPNGQGGYSMNFVQNPGSS